MIVSPEVLSTRNMIWAFVAVSLSGFSSCSSFIALRPSGVAALSSPSMLAAKFMMTDPMAGCSGGTSGNRRRKNGRTTVAIAPIAPPRSPTFMRPSHRVSTPVSPMEISNAVFDESKVACTMAVKTAVSPRKTSFTSATARPTTKKPSQM
jgi:hypothetical protein